MGRAFSRGLCPEEKITEGSRRGPRKRWLKNSSKERRSTAHTHGQRNTGGAQRQVFLKGSVSRGVHNRGLGEALHCTHRDSATQRQHRGQGQHKTGRAQGQGEHRGRTLVSDRCPWECRTEGNAQLLEVQTLGVRNKRSQPFSHTWVALEQAPNEPPAAAGESLGHLGGNHCFTLLDILEELQTSRPGKRSITT